jgi:Condensation domain/TubC N-terminal docking domain
MEQRREIASVSSTDSVAALLGHVREKGVRVWVEEGCLRYKAPKDVLTHQELQQLREAKGEILALLEEKPRPETGAKGAQALTPFHRAPLSYSQRQHYTFYQLDHQAAFRHLLSVQHLKGPLDETAARRTVHAIFRRQDSLRTRIRLCGDTLLQEVASDVDGTLEIEDLSALQSSDQWAHVLQRIEQWVMEPIHVVVGPLVALKLLRLGPEDHVLIVAMEHLIADMWSVNTFVRDFLWGYPRALRDGVVQFPPLPMQFSDYASWQRSRESEWLKAHGPYWQQRLKDCRRQRFPDDPNLSEPHTGWTVVPIALDTLLTARLRQRCRERGTTLVLTLFTAYVALVLRWCEVTDTLIRFESHGRVDPQLMDTIGYFTAPLYIRVSLSPEETFLELFKRVTAEYCSAYEHADASYLESQDPRPEFARNTAFNWIPAIAHEEIPATLELPMPPQCEPVEIENPRLKYLERDTEPFVIFFESLKSLQGGVWFPLRRFSKTSMEHFAAHLRDFVEVLVTEPHACVMRLLVRPSQPSRSPGE